jgi:hypothetical protein
MISEDHPLSQRSEPRSNSENMHRRPVLRAAREREELLAQVATLTEEHGLDTRALKVVMSK